MHLDVFGQQDPELLLDVSTPEGCELLLNVLHPSVSKLQSHVQNLDVSTIMGSRATTGRVWTTGAWAASDVSTLLSSVLHLDVSTPLGLELHLDYQEPEWAAIERVCLRYRVLCCWTCLLHGGLELHLDVSGQQDPLNWKFTFFMDSFRDPPISYNTEHLTQQILNNLAKITMTIFKWFWNS